MDMEVKKISELEMKIKSTLENGLTKLMQKKRDRLNEINNQRDLIRRGIQAIFASPSAEKACDRAIFINEYTCSIDDDFHSGKRCLGLKVSFDLDSEIYKIIRDMYDSLPGTIVNIKYSDNFRIDDSDYATMNRYLIAAIIIEIQKYLLGLKNKFSSDVDISIHNVELIVDPLDINSSNIKMRIDFVFED
jgi:hypothetical protein